MLNIDITTIVRMTPEVIANANRILDQMDWERELRVNNWMTAKNSRGEMPQYGGFRSDFYEYEEEYSYNFLS